MALDILTDIDNQDDLYELLFRNGDFVIDETDDQNIRLALTTGKGNWKQYPLIGGELFKLINYSARSNYSEIVSKELERIGYKLTRFGGVNELGDLDIDVEVIV